MPAKGGGCLMNWRRFISRPERMVFPTIYPAICGSLSGPRESLDESIGDPLAPSSHLSIMCSINAPLRLVLEGRFMSPVGQMEMLYENPRCCCF